MSGKNHPWTPMNLEDKNGNIFKGYACYSCGLVAVAIYGYKDFPPGSVRYIQSAHILVFGVKSKDDSFSKQDADKAAEQAKIPCY